jgi:hypothetical protein
MLTILKRTITPLVFALALATAPFLVAQQTKETLPAPLPAQIINGKTVFISNAGGDTNFLYSGGADRLYNQFYAAMKDWGRYQLAASPAEADLVLAISFSNQFVGENVPKGDGAPTPVLGRALTDPQLRLTVVDPGTRVTLWTFTEHVQFALLQGNRDKNFDRALTNLMNNIRNVAGQPATASAKK